MASLCCSIEMEPRTLNEGQLSHAREAAADIVQKMEPSESSNVFIEGIKPVLTIKVMEEMVEMRHQVRLPAEPCEKETEVVERRHQFHCACTITTVDESPDTTQLIREPVSAPF